MRNPNACVSNPNKFVTCAGSRKHIEYSVKLLDDGTLDFVESGYTDIQDQINAWYPLTDMSYIVSKLMAGDVSVIQRNSGAPIFGDFTNIPKTPIDILNIVNESKRYFERLPVDVRASFDNDFNKWFASIEKSKKTEDVAEPTPSPETSDTK